MERLFSVLQVIAPIFLAVFLGILARRRHLMQPEAVAGLQQFVMKFGLPCVVFQSCLTARMDGSALVSMGLILPPLFLATLWAFRARKGKYPYHNLPQIFAAHETGMLGIPLVITLFGSAQAYRMGVLDLTQAIVCYPVIALLTSDTGENPSLGSILKSVFTSPFTICSLSGLALNLTGVTAWMEAAGVLGIVTDSAGFLAQPVSALMLFYVGYHFSLDPAHRGAILGISGIYAAWFGLCCGAAELVLWLLPGVDEITPWVMVLYFALPASYLAPGLGRSQEDSAVCSGVCSVLTVVCLVVFCILAAIIV